MQEMKLRVQVIGPAGRRSRAARIETCQWSEGRHNYVVVSLQERRATMQVMLGVSLRARWDATIVLTNRTTEYNDQIPTNQTTGYNDQLPVTNRT